MTDFATTIENHDIDPKERARRLAHVYQLILSWCMPRGTPNQHSTLSEDAKPTTVTTDLANIKTTTDASLQERECIESLEQSTLAHISKNLVLAQNSVEDEV